MSDPLKTVIEYLRNNGSKILYASYIGSYGTEDWLENISDIDIVVIVDKKPRRLPILDNIDIIILTLEELNNIDIVLAINIVFSKPVIDVIDLRKIIKKKICREEIMKLLNVVVKNSMNFSIIHQLWN